MGKIGKNEFENTGQKVLHNSINDTQKNPG